MESKNKTLREQYKTIANYLGWVYIGAHETDKNNAGWHRPFYVPFPDGSGTGRRALKELLITETKSPSFVTRKTLDLKFRYDWNNLMRLVQKLESDGYTVQIIKDHCVIDQDGHFRVSRWCENNKQQAVYEACLELIQKMKDEPKR